MAWPATTLGRWSAAGLSSLTGVTELTDNTGNGYPLQFGGTAPTLGTDDNGNGYLIFAEDTTSALTTPSPGSTPFFDASRFDPAESWALLLLVDVLDCSQLKTGSPDRVFGTNGNFRGALRLNDEGSGTYDCIWQTTNHLPATALVNNQSTDTGYPILISVWFNGSNATKLTTYRTFPAFREGHSSLSFSSTTTITNDAASSNWQGETLALNENQHGLRFYSAAVLAKTGATEVTQQHVDDAALEMMADGWFGSYEGIVIWGPGDSLTNVREQTNEARVPGWAERIQSQWKSSRVRTFDLANAGARINQTPTIGSWWDTDARDYAEELCRLISQAYPVTFCSMIGTNDVGDIEAEDANAITVSEIADEIRAAATLLKDAGTAANITGVWLGTCPDWQGDTLSPLTGRVAVNENILATPGNFDHTLDVLTDDDTWFYGNNLSSEDSLMDDNTHPNTAGNLDITNLFYPELSNIIFSSTYLPLTVTASAGGSSIIVTYDASVSWSSDPSFTVTKSGGPSITVDSISGTVTNTVTLSISGASPASGETWTVALDNSDGELTDTTSGSYMASFESFSVAISSSNPTPILAPRPQLRPDIAPVSVPSPNFLVNAQGYTTRSIDPNIEATVEPIVMRGPVTISLPATSSNNEIRYTTNNRNPTSKSLLYTGPISITRNLTGSDNTVIKARIFNKNNPNIKSRISKIVVKVF